MAGSGHINTNAAAKQGSVLVVDQATAFAEALVELLQDAGHPAATSDSDCLAIELPRYRPSVLLLDADNALSSLSPVQQGSGNVRVLLLTGRHPDHWKDTQARSGAVGVVTRNISAAALLGAVRRASAGLPVREPPLPTPTRPRDATGHPLDLLTNREVEVLRALLSGGRGNVVARELGISPHTVRTHVQNILGKLGVRSRFEAAAVAREAGLRPLALLTASEGAG